MSVFSRLPGAAGLARVPAHHSRRAEETSFQDAHTAQLAGRPWSRLQTRLRPQRPSVPLHLPHLETRSATIHTLPTHGRRQLRAARPPGTSAGPRTRAPARARSGGHTASRAPLGQVRGPAPVPGPVPAASVPRGAGGGPWRRRPWGLEGTPLIGAQSSPDGDLGGGTECAVGGPREKVKGRVRASAV